jgi:hypothetical protein
MPLNERNTRAIWRTAFQGGPGGHIRLVTLRHRNSDGTIGPNSVQTQWKAQRKPRTQQTTSLGTTEGNLETRTWKLFRIEQSLDMIPDIGDQIIEKNGTVWELTKVDHKMLTNVFNCDTVGGYPAIEGA